MQFRTVTPQKAKTEKIRPERIKEFEENVLEVSRVARVVKGGRRFKFRVTVVIGNKNGKVGVGIGKGSEVVTAVNKAVNQAKKDMIEVTRNKSTIPFDIEGKFKGARVMLKPAPKGTGIIAGGAVRAVVDLAGISDISSKMLGSASKINNAYATFFALQEITNKIKVGEK
ncbi:30S ribosomal protein S5 [bacterium]|nr:30S ribosomal protein S5 [bacterium]